MGGVTQVTEGWGGTPEVKQVLVGVEGCPRGAGRGGVPGRRLWMRAPL